MPSGAIWRVLSYGKFLITRMRDDNNMAQKRALLISSRWLNRDLFSGY